MDPVRVCIVGPLTLLSLAGAGIGWLISRRRRPVQAPQANTAMPQNYQEITWTRYDGALAAEEISPGQKHIAQPEWYHRDHPCFDEYRRPLGDRWEPIPGTWYEMAPFGPSPVPADAPFPDDLGLIRDYCAGARSGLSRAALLQFFLVAHTQVFNASSPNPMIRKMERDAHVAILQNPHAFNKEIAPLLD